MTLLLLGGTTESAALAQALAQSLPHLAVISSLAGRTASPRPLPGRVRTGGFGGVTGLRGFLREKNIRAVIDATHPFAATISAHAAAACLAEGVPRLVLARAEWPQRAEDRWQFVASGTEAARELPLLGRRAFLTVGSRDINGFNGVLNVWFLVRLLTPEPLSLPQYHLITGQGPFRAQDEEALLREHKIDVLVTKAAGGEATYGKILAARRLGIPVLLIQRPPLPPGEVTFSQAAALAWAHRTAINF